MAVVADPQGADDSSVMLCDNASMVNVRTFNTEGPVSGPAGRDAE